MSDETWLVARKRVDPWKCPLATPLKSAKLHPNKKIRFYTRKLLIENKIAFQVICFEKGNNKQNV